MARARLHITCGNCGCNDQLTFTVVLDGVDISDTEPKFRPAVWVRCANCSTLHDLANSLPETQPERTNMTTTICSTWYTPAERRPTFADGPRRFTTKVEVEVECALGVERRCYFVGGGFDDDDCLGKRVLRWRPVSSS